jgi:hemerythrin-like domain-containing protein
MAERSGKRAEALQPLSRDHLKALLTAKALKEATDPEDVRRRFLDFWHPDGGHHFRVEEEVLLPWWARYAEPDRPAIARMLEEHLEIRRQALRLADAEATLDDLHRLGHLLHDHVRFEERHLFPLIEESLTPEQLEQPIPAVLEAEGEA